MGKIRALPSNVVGQIAAGEVVERPAHLIKELVENSLDAGATEIEIFVSDQAESSIEIRDNGHGMEADDLVMALHPHATSKIVSSDDLWNLHTFGFRGEALASIAAVSHVKLSSRMSASGNAFSIEGSFGQFSPIKETSMPVGTHLRVEKLFENVPARLKFLKSKRTEVALIRQTLRAIALSNEAVGFRFFYNAGLDFYLPPRQTLPQRVALALQFGGVLREVHFESGAGGWQVHAVVPDVREVAQNFKNFWIFVQNRWVQDRTVQAAVMEAHRSLLMHGEYPQGILKIQGPSSSIDVNVHPTKSQIRFENSGEVFRIVYKALRSHLEADQKQMTSEDAQTNPLSTRPFTTANSPVPSPASEKLFQITDTVYPQKKSYSQSLNPFPLTAPTAQRFSSAPSDAPLEPKTGFWGGHQVLAQMKLTYILVQGQEGCFLIDQHAAHERILYERVLQHIETGSYSTQVEMIPYLLELLPEQVEFLLTLQTDLGKWGVQIEQFGQRSIIITESLSFLKIEQVAKSLKTLAQNHADYTGADSFQKIIHDFAAMTACHSAIRAGDVLDLGRMSDLMREMDECPFSHFCPHGRPVFVEWTWRKLELEFGRITS